MEKSLPNIRIVSRQARAATDILEAMDFDWPTKSERFLHLTHAGNFRNDIVIFDMAECSEVEFDYAEAWRGNVASLDSITIFIATDEERRGLLQRGLLSGANCIRRPVSKDNLGQLIRSLVTTRAIENQRKASEYNHRLELQFPDQAQAVHIGQNVLDDIMSPFERNQIVDIRAIATKTSVLVDTLGDTGIDRWMASVRIHHSPTYQHSLLVTGTILAFGKSLHMGSADLNRLAVAGLLHDLGKSEIPQAILDKPSSLTPEEQEIMRRHPGEGVKRASKMPGISQDLIAMIGDHHECLDGSGYPNAKMAGSISDPVRLLTIADIFSALVEQRSYKPTMSASSAIEIMRKMEGKIDMSFLKAVEPVMMQVTP